MSRNNDLKNQVEELEQRLEQQRLQLERILTLQAEPSTAPQPQADFDVTRIPDIIKLIPGYDGNVKALPAWINSVQQKFDCALARVPAADKDAASKVWSSVIRDKITGKANDVLISNQTECEWDQIKAQLSDRFGDKRDLATIISKIPFVNIENSTIEQFYEKFSEILSDLSAKINLDPGLQPCAKAVISSYEMTIMNAFVDGLPDPISALTRTSRPTSLLSAYQYAQEQADADERKKEKQKFLSRTNVSNQRPPIQPYHGGQPNYSPNQRPPAQPYHGGQPNYPANQRPPYQTHGHPNAKPFYSQPPNQRPPHLMHGASNSNVKPQYNQSSNRPTMAPIKKEPYSQNNFRRNHPSSNQIHYQEMNENFETPPEEAHEYYDPQNLQEIHNHPLAHEPPVDDEVNFQLDPNQGQTE